MERVTKMFRQFFPHSISSHLLTPLVHRGMHGLTGRLALTVTSKAISLIISKTGVMHDLWFLFSIGKLS